MPVTYVAELLGLLVFCLTAPNPQRSSSVPGRLGPHVDREGAPGCLREQRRLLGQDMDGYLVLTLDLVHPAIYSDHPDAEEWAGRDHFDQIFGHGKENLGNLAKTPGAADAVAGPHVHFSSWQCASGDSDFLPLAQIDERRRTVLALPAWSPSLSV